MKFRQGKSIVFTFVALCLFLGNTRADTAMESNQTIAAENLFEGFVYYADNQKTALKSVGKRFSATLSPHEKAMEIIKSLLQGPSDARLSATWPKETKITSFFIADDGKAYIDLNLEPERMENMDTGTELLAIYSMVNSLTVNIPSIKMVKLLIQGEDAVTLAGHIDLECFYKTNMLIVK